MLQHGFLAGVVEEKHSYTQRNISKDQWQAILSAKGFKDNESINH